MVEVASQLLKRGHWSPFACSRSRLPLSKFMMITVTTQSVDQGHRCLFVLCGLSISRRGPTQLIYGHVASQKIIHGHGSPLGYSWPRSPLSSFSQKVIHRHGRLLAGSSRSRCLLEGYSQSRHLLGDYSWSQLPLRWPFTVMLLLEGYSSPRPPPSWLQMVTFPPRR